MSAERIAFRALVDFYSPELGSHYVAGLLYTVRPGAVALEHLAARWAAEGRIEFVLDAAPPTALAGTGTVH